MAETPKAAEAPQATVTERVVTREIRPDPPLGPNATSTDVPDEHFFTVNGVKVNAFNEPIDSPEAKKRRG